MNILGLDNLLFGVDDMAASRRYLLDYGLDERSFDAAVGGTYAALDGTSITIRHSADARLPPLPAGAHSPALRETTYGVDNNATLLMLQAELAKDRAVTLGADGVLRAVDDGGFAIAFRKSVRKPYTARYLGFNVPGQTPGRALNDCAANPSELIKPRTLSHVVYFVPDVKKAETFYARLGFISTDRFENVGPFMRPAGTQDHHTLFMIQRFNDHMVGCNHFTFHFGSAGEVLQHGWEFVRKGYKSFWGPGRHIFGSNYFWYFNSPFGALMEMDADMDIHDDSWVPRECPPGKDNSQIFLFNAAPKWAPGE